MLQGYVPGDFSLLQNDRVRIKEDEFISNPSSLKELNKPIQAAQCILNHQDPRLIPKMQNELCVGITVLSWRLCGMTISDNCEEACDLNGGNLPGVTKQDFDPNDCLKIEFEVNEYYCDNMAMWEEIVAKQRAKAKVLLEAEMAKKLVTFVAANGDQVDMTNIAFDASYTVNGTEIVIPSNEWGASIFSEFQYMNEQCDLMNPLYLTGKNFHTEKFLNKYKSQSCCNNNDLLESNDFNICFDTRNIDSTLGGRYTIVMDQDSILFWNTHEHRSTTPVQMSSSHDLWEWYDTLPRLTYTANGSSTPIYMDVTMQRKCYTEGGKRRYKRCYEYVVNFGLHEGICSCDEKRGILVYKNDCVGC